MLFTDFLKYFDEIGVCDPFQIAKASEDNLIRCDTVGDHWRAELSAGGAHVGLSRGGLHRSLPQTKDPMPGQEDWHLILSPVFVGRSGCSTFKFNPHFSLTAQSEKVFITMYQPDRRFANAYKDVCGPTSARHQHACLDAHSGYLFAKLLNA
eukprot:SAG11_NODE_2050_length_3882_cov_13.229842_3_plen_152_part_00